MKRAPLVLLLLGCGGSVPLPFEGTWTGTLTRDFECFSGNGGSSDVDTSWTISRQDDALSISTTAADCPTLTATVDSGDGTLARLDVAHCESTHPGAFDGGVQEPINNTRTWTDGHLRLRSDGKEMLVDAWEHDEGDAAGAPYVCDGLSYGALALEGG